MKRGILIFFLIAASAGLLPAQTTYTWTGADPLDNDWSSDGNWTGDAAPPSGAGTQLAFQATPEAGGVVLQDIAAPFELSGIAFSTAGGSTGFDLAGNGLRFLPTAEGASPLILLGGTLGHTISQSIDIGSHSLTLLASTGSAGRVLAFNGAITGDGVIAKTNGSFTLALGAANPFSGLIDIRNGALRLDHAGAVANAHVQLRADTTLEVNAANAVIGGLSGSGLVNLGSRSVAIGGVASKNTTFTGGFALGSFTNAITITKTGGDSWVFDVTSGSPSIEVLAGSATVNNPVWVRSNRTLLTRGADADSGQRSTLNLDSIQLERLHGTGAAPRITAEDGGLITIGVFHSIDNDLIVSGRRIADILVSGQNEATGFRSTLEIGQWNQGLWHNSWGNLQLRVEDGGRLITHGVGSSSVPPTDWHFTVTGDGSAWIHDGDNPLPLIVHLTLSDGGLLRSENGLTLSQANVTLDGGRIETAFLSLGSQPSTLQWTSGEVHFTTGQEFAPDNGIFQLIGENGITAGQTISVNGRLDVLDGSRVTLAGDTLRAVESGLQPIELDWRSGTVNITGADGLATATAPYFRNATLTAGQTLDVARRLTISNGDLLSSPAARSAPANSPSTAPRSLPPPARSTWTASANSPAPALCWAASPAEPPPRSGPKAPSRWGTRAWPMPCNSRARSTPAAITSFSSVPRRRAWATPPRSMRAGG